MYTVQYNFWTFFRFKNWLCKCIKIYFWLHTAHVHCALIVQSMLQMSSISQQSTFKTIAVITVALASLFPQSHFKTISVITVALTSIFSQSHFKNIAVITVALTPHKVKTIFVPTRHDGSNLLVPTRIVDLKCTL